MTRSPAPFLPLIAALLCVAAGAAARPVADLPAFPPAGLAEAQSALDAIEAEMATLVQEHPDLFPAPPKDTWSGFMPDHPQVALSTAANELGEVRDRASLGLPAGETHTSMSKSEFMDWLRADELDLEARSWQRIHAWADESHARSGASVEDHFAKAWPAYRVQSGQTSFLQVVSGETRTFDGNLTLLFPLISGREGLMALVEHYGPSPEAAPAEPLTLDDYAQLRAAQPELLSPRQSSARASLGLADQRAAAGDAYGALAFLLEAANYEEVGAASDRMVFQGQDLAPELEGQYGSWLGEPQSLLWRQPQEWAHAVLESLPEGTPARGNHAGNYARETLGRYAALSTLREGGNIPPAETDGTGAPGPGPAAALAALGAAAVAARLRRR